MLSKSLVFVACWRTVMMIGVGSLITGERVDARSTIRGATRVTPPVQTGAPAPSAPAKPAAKESTPLTVRNIRLEACDPVEDGSSSSILKFDMLNDGASRLTNIVVEVSILKKRQPDDSDAEIPLVRPFVIRGKAVLQPGYSMEYELRLQNLSPGCDCTARVNVVSVEALADSKSFR